MSAAMSVPATQTPSHPALVLLLLYALCATNCLAWEIPCVFVEVFMESVSEMSMER